MTGCLVKTFVCEERRRRNCSEADETADMQGKERKEMRNPETNLPGPGVVSGICWAARISDSRF